MEWYGVYEFHNYILKPKYGNKQIPRNVCSEIREDFKNVGISRGEFKIFYCCEDYVKISVDLKSHNKVIDLTLKFKGKK